MYTFKRDRYQKNRGGVSRVLDITCDHCGSHVAFYQKDGPGMLKRMYVDRFIDAVPEGKSLTCNSCDRQLATQVVYKKEDRLAYRLYAGAVNKKIIAASQLP